MTFRKWMIFILGFAGAVVPGRASLSYYTASSQNSFNSMTSTLTALGLETFSPGAGGYSGLFYQDATTLADFDGCANASSCQNTDVNVSNGTTSLFVANNALVELTNLPTNTYAVELSVTTHASFGFFCAQGNVSSFNDTTCHAGGAGGTGEVVVSGTSDIEFIGAVSSGAPLTNLWIGPDTSGQLQINSFEFFTQGQTGGQAAERSTFFLFGGGLILLGFLGRFRRALALS